MTGLAVSDDYVFVAEGPNGSAIAVMSHDGTQLDTIRNIPGPGALVADGPTLYVTAYYDDAIYVYDVESLPPTKVDELSTLPMTGPTSIALASGRLWFTGVNDQQHMDASLGSMTTAGTDVDEHFPSSFESWQANGYCGDINHSGAADDRLIVHAFDWCTNPDGAYLYDVSTSPPTRLADYGVDPSGVYYGQPVAVLPDGSGFVVGAADGSITTRVFDDLDPGPSYDAPVGWGMGESIATGSSGLIASSAYGTTTQSSKGVAVWNVGESAPITSFALPTDDGRIDAKGLAFSPNGHRLFIASERFDRVFVHVVDPDAAFTTVSIERSRETVVYGDGVKLTAELVGPPAGETVEFQSVESGILKAVASCITGAMGRCSATVRPRESTSYVATYGGSESWAASISDPISVGVQISVEGELLRYYRRSGQYFLYHDNDRVFYTVTVKPPRPGEPVLISLEYNLGSGWQDGGSNRYAMDDRGKVRIYFPARALPKGSYRIISGAKGSRPELLSGHSRWAYFRITS